MRFFGKFGEKKISKWINVAWYQVYGNLKKGLDVSEVDETGLLHQFVLKWMQGDIRDLPERNARPKLWEERNTTEYQDNSSFD